jgi:hypothetical protein
MRTQQTQKALKKTIEFVKKQYNYKLGETLLETENQILIKVLDDSEIDKLHLSATSRLAHKGLESINATIVYKTGVSKRLKAK